MAEKDKPLLIKRYASRRLYNTEISDYVTLEDIAALVREGRDVQIIDLKSGDDLTGQYLLQIVADHEARGQNVLPVEVLTDLVRSYASNMQSIVPSFLAASFDMLRASQEKMLHGFNPMAVVPGFETLQKQQEAFIKSIISGAPAAWGLPGLAHSEQKDETPPPSKTAASNSRHAAGRDQELANIRQQLAELQEKMSKL